MNEWYVDETSVQSTPLCNKDISTYTTQTTI